MNQFGFPPPGFNYLHTEQLDHPFIGAVRVRERADIFQHPITLQKWAIRYAVDRSGSPTYSDYIPMTLR